jgi:shikimate dehydrogenase
LRRNAGFDPADRRCAVLGAGGAARAIVRALGAAGARSVVVVNRTAERAQRAALLAGPVGAVGEIDVTGDADLVVNATSIGLSGGDGTEGAALASRVGTGQLVVDLRYGRRPTPFLAAASARGAAVRDGLGMLVHQAALQVAIHTGLPGPTDAMWAAVDHVGTSDGRWRDLAEGI